MKLGKKGKWVAGALAAAGTASGLFASYNDVRNDLMAQEQPWVGELHKSQVCKINAAARDYTVQNGAFKTNLAVQAALKSAGLEVDVMIPEIEIGERELAAALRAHEESCEAKYGKSGFKHLTDGVTFTVRKVGEILFALGVREALVFAGEHLYLLLLVENDQGPKPTIMVAEGGGPVRHLELTA
jgi:hypothetical protein